jgi:hypothetical protein
VKHTNTFSDTCLLVFLHGRFGGRRNAKTRCSLRCVQVYVVPHVVQLMQSHSRLFPPCPPVCYDLGCTLRDSLAIAEMVVRMAKLRNGLPYRLTCLQFCYDDPMMETFLSVLRTKAGPESYLRARNHFGACQARLFCCTSVFFLLQDTARSVEWWYRLYEAWRDFPGVHFSFAMGSPGYKSHNMESNCPFSNRSSFWIFVHSNFRVS